MTRANEMNLYIEELDNVRNHVDEYVKTRIFCLYKTKRLQREILIDFQKFASDIIDHLESKDVYDRTPCERVALEFCYKIKAM